MEMRVLANNIPREWNNTSATIPMSRKISPLSYID
jgi:hypothetical protein